MINSVQMNRYKNLINKIDGSFNKDIITWRRTNIATIPEFFEDNLRNSYVDIELQVLIGYNYFRTWPITKDTLEGAHDEQNMVAQFNLEYLKTLGYTTADGYFNFEPEDDRFFHRGIKYKAFGDTFTSQAGDEPLMFQIVLRRDIIATGTDRTTQL